MLRILLVLISSVAPLLIAKAVNESVEKSKSLTVGLVDKVSHRILRQLAWTLIGVSFVSSGFILAVLEAAAVWGIEFPLSLAFKIGLMAVGSGCLYMGLRTLNPDLEKQEQISKSSSSSPDWQHLVGLLFEKMKSTPDESRKTADRSGLSSDDIDRIVSALRKTSDYSQTYYASTGPKAQSYSDENLRH